MKIALPFFCFYILASSHVYGDVPEIIVTKASEEVLPPGPFTKADCSLGVEKDGSTCEAYIRVYKWSDAEKKCVKAIYGGCNPTKNNFRTKEDCVKTATPVCSD
ncbi:chymotrypsin inhibitor SCI-II-like isoform X2 [Diabrotica virgifera virgifera]|uniref:BPTI/Kunitz inhibitor domain-containing protein n=1 Tax=Diabrotica virgifera virgifera TaxID=50390 RepID=A0ABM5L7V2_DIAVI|nr:chymotrypsin inhibitor SCI-II-like isoform X2 [Diabrotica virgifera virgifera]